MADSKTDAKSNALTIALVTGILGVVGIAITGYFNYLNNRVQIELPINATQAAEARSLQLTSIPSQTILTGVLSLTSTPTPVQPLVPTVSGSRSFSLANAIRQDFNPIGATQIEIDNGQMLVTGVYYQPVIIKFELPKNFKARIKLHVKTDEDSVVMGIGDGKNWSPNYRFSMNDKYFWLKQATATDKDVFVRSGGRAAKIEPNKQYDITFERKNGIITTYFDGKPFGFTTQDQDTINSYAYFFVGAHRSDDSIGAAYFEELSIEEIQ